jgi:type II secretory pathway component GspD/PulD (secretin)
VSGFLTIPLRRVGERRAGRWRTYLAAGISCGLLFALDGTLWAQVTQAIVPTQSAPAQDTPNPANPGGAATTAAQDKPAEAPASGQSPTEEKKKPEAGAAEDTTVKRPTTPPRVPDPREFEAKLDGNSRVKFNFHGQMWPDVLQWLASLGGHSLDWQELPNDFIHVDSNQELTLTETRDLFNRLLFERGFTMVQQGNVLLVLKLDKLDPSLLRRIEDESELLDLPPHDMVKITFPLPPELKADKAAEDVKPLLTRYAKVQPLMATNRLLIVDLVGNLREVSRLVNTEHAAATGNLVPREFPIRYARADHIADQVMILLGLDPSSRRTPEELQVEQQRLQLFTQMQQQGKDIAKYLRGDDAPTVHLAVNHRNNSIVANAPPKEMAIIERSINLLDLPNGQLAGAGPASLEMKRYVLVTLKPQSVVTALQNIGDLDPRSQLQVDTEAKTVFAHATPPDHQKIQAMIDQLDGTGRQFDVIWLRRLPADAVAETIRNLMVGKEEKKQDDRRSYFYYGFRGDETQQNNAPNKGFRIDADTHHNRLLLWANAGELEEVRKLLVKLGEIPGETGNPHTLRAVHAGDAATARQVLQQLRSIWPTVLPNPLEVEPTESTPDETTDKLPRSTAPDVHDEAQRPPTPPATGSHTLPAATRSISPPDNALVLADPADAPAPQALPDKLPGGTDSLASSSRISDVPVHVSVDPDGRLLIRSRDTRALDYAEELLDRIVPERKNFEVFYLKHASASLVTLNLEEYFEEETKEGSGAEDAYWAGWYGYGYSANRNDESTSQGGLSARKPLRFIYDFDTNSILVSNASPDQLAIVRSLIEVYDKPISEDSISARRFQMFKIRHAQATAVAETLKEVYRDLLSSKDKVFERNGNEKEQTSQSTNYYRVYGSVSDDEKKPTKVKASFAGAISVGVDETTNTVIVSAQEEWMPSIAEMIRFLDTEAAPFRDTVQVVNTHLSGKSLQAALARVMGSEASKVTIKDTPETPPAEPPAQPAAEAKTETASAATP